jgi:hypothetical protein
MQSPCLRHVIFGQFARGSQFHPSLCLSILSSEIRRSDSTEIKISRWHHDFIQRSGRGHPFPEFASYILIFSGSLGFARRRLESALTVDIFIYRRAP